MKASPPLPQWPLWLSSKTLSKSPSFINMHAHNSYTWVITRGHDVVRNARVNKFDWCTTPAPASAECHGFLSPESEIEEGVITGGLYPEQTVGLMYHLTINCGKRWHNLLSVCELYHTFTFLGLCQFWPPEKALLFPYRELRYQIQGKFICTQFTLGW